MRGIPVFIQYDNTRVYIDLNTCMFSDFMLFVCECDAKLVNTGVEYRIKQTIFLGSGVFSKKQKQQPTIFSNQTFFM